MGLLCEFYVILAHPVGVEQRNVFHFTSDRGGVRTVSQSCVYMCIHVRTVCGGQRCHSQLMLKKSLFGGFTAFSFVACDIFGFWAADWSKFEDFTL